MSRKGFVFFDGTKCGLISETDEGYLFEYDDNWTKSPDAQPVSLTLPLSQKKVRIKNTVCIFRRTHSRKDGCLLLQSETGSSNPRRRMGSAFCSVAVTCIGAVDSGRIVQMNNCLCCGKRLRLKAERHQYHGGWHAIM